MVLKAKKLLVWILVGILLLPISVVLANSGPPPTMIWLNFDYQTSKPTTLEGVQLFGCDTSRCDHPLLQQYGKCYSEGCSSSPPALTGVVDISECLENKCLLTFYFYYQDVSAIKVVGQFSDRTRESNVFSGEFPRYGTIAWRIVVQDTDLLILKDEHFQDPYATYDNFIKFFVFTVVVELLAAAIMFYKWLKSRDVNLFKGLMYVLLVNLVSYPVTWYFWPSLGQFQPNSIRRFGHFIVIVAAVCTIFLVDISLAKGEKRRRKMIITSFWLAIAAVISPVWLCAVSYSNFWITAQGLPIQLTILLAEVFAVTFEAVLIYFLTRNFLALSLKQTTWISFVMNASSFLLGKLVLSRWL
ncbi:MAG: hypothetical protein GY832_06450 [Chloroflexi bacterium]|nr:hypothetical protein [Chloroflexota bacterium]